MSGVSDTTALTWVQHALSQLARAVAPSWHRFVKHMDLKMARGTCGQLFARAGVSSLTRI
ncbi:hypothetical protein [Glycomyces xiaoerkulensis]|uniref:hypothetical protein n=1 Tax=Glycomyces xiaoerkulensis TaxID=2038139 RepID=UPI0012FFE801|nr:hypothetical protein [Glycomyces xiaoerkulensis]